MSRLLLAGLLGALTQATVTTPPPREDGQGMYSIPATTLPPSSLLPEETKELLRQAYAERVQDAKAANCGDVSKMAGPAIATYRACELRSFLASKAYARLQGLYPVRAADERIGGVYTESFVPVEGVAPENRRRVLINLHGGGFLIGDRTFSKVESMPIAAIGRIKVVSIDYSLAPENSFPVASDEVEKVYRELLKKYSPDSIGLYGCSAGGMLVAQVVARLITDRIPTPGAVGMFCGAATHSMEGDSGQLAINRPFGRTQDNPYYRGVNPTNPLAFPIRSTAILSKFPPSLLITGTRDFAMSSTVNTHSRLVALKVPAELHVWEGLGHGFFYDPRLAESREAYDVIVSFFKGHLKR